MSPRKGREVMGAGMGRKERGGVKELNSLYIVRPQKTLIQHYRHYATDVILERIQRLWMYSRCYMLSL